MLCKVCGQEIKNKESEEVKELGIHDECCGPEPEDYRTLGDEE